jgi:hypothetical protein
MATDAGVPPFAPALLWLSRRKRAVRPRVFGGTVRGLLFCYNGDGVNSAVVFDRPRYTIERPVRMLEREMAPSSSQLPKGATVTMSFAKSAIKHLRATGNVVEAVEVVLGKRSLDENGGPSSRQSQSWFMPDQDALNQFILRIMDKLPDATYTTKEYENGSQAGYEVTVTGDFMDGDLASLAAVKGGVMRLDNPPANL